MALRERIDRSGLAKLEVQGAELGDARLTKRLEKIVESLAKRPSESLPDAMGNEAALEATYRFLGNEKVSAEAVLAPHVAQTCVRASELNRVLAVFDTTEARFGGERAELGYLTHERGRGLLAHVGLAVNPHSREPLGVLRCETVVRRGKKKHRKEGRGAEDNESQRWHRGVADVYGMLPSAICVMDREADIFSLVAAMKGRNQDFVIRAAQNRATPDGALWDLLDYTKLITRLKLELVERKRRRRKSETARHPPRSAHTAKLELRARPIKLWSPSTNGLVTASRNATAVELNLVHVIEPNPPSGDEPVEWVLLTSLPINSKANVAFIVDAYRARWVIEEFFKALKSGCALESRQLESVRSITNALAVSLPIAWLLLRLRHLSRDQPHKLATTVLSPFMMICLRALFFQQTRKRLPTRPTCRELTWAIAALGGHLKNNGEPGLLVLGRGLAKLIAAADAILAFKNAEDVINLQPGGQGHLLMSLCFGV